ncbi:MAG: aminoacyl-histidine dipeptidase [Clostridia bacterium]|nr:aminoacyl-histidine dipeptidase [Clostridia bacterium]
MGVLSGLQPERVFSFFEEICGIPHGSGNTRQISNWLAAFARVRNLEFYQDDLGNIIIIKEASSGYEAGEPVILQGHMDMVCNKAAGCTKDMTKEGLDLIVKGDAITADGTTLGGDDGIAAAFLLAILDDDDLPHPRVECVLTVDEEKGLIGAKGLDVSPLKGRRLINIDSEDEGILTVGCAGGVSAISSLPVSREAFQGQVLKIKLAGLAGGHSGADITKGQENALKSLGRVLFEILDRTNARLVRLDGGVADNAIPTCASAVIAVPDAAKVTAICDEYRRIFAHEFKVDPDVDLTVDETETDLQPMDQLSGLRAVAYLIGTPNGIQKMTQSIDHLPQTSLSLGVARTSAAAVEYIFCIRSSVDSEREMLTRRLESQINILGGNLRRDAPYPGWEYNPVSPLRDLICEVYRDQTGKDMIVEAIHAGLECGYFAGKIPGLDCVSIGPDMKAVHTPNETLYIGSVQRTWELVRETLARMK